MYVGDLKKRHIVGNVATNFESKIFKIQFVFGFNGKK